MKVLILMLIASVSLAKTFSTLESLDIQSNNPFELMKTVDVKIDNVRDVYNTHTTNVDVVLNGELKTYKANFIKNISVDYDTRVDLYKVELLKVDIADGWGCEEKEYVSYSLEFTWAATRDPDDREEVEVTAFKATKYYSWDVCHDMSPTKDIINYQEVK